MSRLKGLRWPWWVGLVAITVLGVALRLYHLGSNSYWLDEAISVLIARLPVRLIISNAGRSSHPGLYYLLLHYWLPWGGAKAWGRGLSVVWGALTLPAVFTLGTLLFNRKTGLLASALLALAPFHIAYSQEARMYAQLTFLGVIALICFHQAIQTGRSRWWLATGIAVAVALATHLFASLVLAAMTIYTLLYQRESTIRILLVNLGAAMIAIPHLVSIAGGTQRHLGGLRPLVGKGRPSPLFPLTAVHLLLGGYSITPKTMFWGLLCTLSVFVITLWEARRAILRRTRRWRSLVLLLLVVGVTLLGPFTLAQIQPIFLPERTLLIALPPMILLIAWGISDLKWANPLPALSIGLALVMGLSLRGYYVNPSFQKPPMRAAAVLVQQQLEPGDAVLHTSDGSYLPFLVYVDHPHSFLLQGDPDPRKTEEVYQLWGGRLVSRENLEGHFGRLWVIVALDHSMEFQRDALAWYESRFPLLGRYNVGGIGVYLLDLTVTKTSDRDRLWRERTSRPETAGLQPSSLDVIPGYRKPIEP